MVHEMPQSKTGANLERDENFESLVNLIVGNKNFTVDTINSVIELERRAHAKGFAYKVQVLQEALRRVTLRELPRLKKDMEKELAKRAV